MEQGSDGAVSALDTYFNCTYRESSLQRRHNCGGLARSHGRRIHCESVQAEQILHCIVNDDCHITSKGRTIYHIHARCTIVVAVFECRHSSGVTMKGFQNICSSDLVLARCACGESESFQILQTLLFPTIAAVRTVSIAGEHIELGGRYVWQVQ